MANSLGPPAAGLQAVAHRRHGVVVQEPLGAERHHQQTVGVLRGGPGQLRSQGADVDRRRTVRVGTGIEGRCHQRVPVVFAAKIQPIPGVPGLENRAQGGDQLGHPPDRIVELGTEALLDLCANLSAQAQDEPAVTEQLMVVGLMRQMDRVARERNCDIRHQTQTAHRGGHGQRGEDVVRTFEGGNATGAGVAQLARALGGIREPVEGSEDFNGVSLRNPRDAVD